MFRIGAARLLKPEDRIVCAGFQQMHLSNPVIILPDLWIAGAEADGSLLCRDGLFNRPGYKFAIPKSGYRVHPIPVDGDYGLIMSNGLLKALLRAQHLGFGVMHKRRAGERREGPVGEYLCSAEV